MTDNLNESNLANTEAKIDNGNHDGTWQLNALTTALGDLSLTVSDSLSVGRGSDNDVVLGSKEISRNHAVLSVSNSKLYVKDLDSSNGTFVNDERIEGNKSTLLHAEDKLGFASFEFQVTASAVEHAQATPMDPALESNNAEPEDVVGSIQQNLEATNPNINNDSLVGESVAKPAVESSLPAAAVEEAIVVRPSTNVDAVSAATSTQPVVKETNIGEVLAASAGVGAAAMSATAVNEAAVNQTSMASTAADSLATETLPATATEETLMTEDKLPENNEQSATEKLSVAEPIMEEPVVAESLVSESIVAEPMLEESIDQKPLVAEPIVEESVADEELTYKKGIQQEVSPEHDKTTTTALQEEADPDVLRAKQAATSQFSGTANLGTGRDLGTAGNNALDQAIDNPANNAQGEKKASGGWFIWVFIAILIIAIALWLFNMGGA